MGYLDVNQIAHFISLGKLVPNLKKKIISLALAAMCILTLPSCKQEAVDITPPETSTVTPVQNQGSIFATSGFKIRTVITPKNTLSLDPLVFEIYVDASGNGSGLMGYKDDIYEVIISSDKLYVALGTNTVAYISDVTGHLIPATLDVKSTANLEGLGFTVSDSRVTGYKGDVDGLLYDGAYQSSDTVYDAIPVSDSNSMTLTALVNDVLEVTGVGVVTDPNASEITDPSRESYYGNSDLGIKIHDQVYSITDFCDPNTYFEQQMPSGLVPEYGWNKDVRVELLHITYTSSDGSTEFMTTDGYVQAISTSSDFSWLDIYKGMSEDDLKVKLGIGLKKDAALNFKPMVEGLLAARGKSNRYVATVGSLSVEFVCDSKTKTVVSMTISNYIDFMQEGA